MAKASTIFFVIVLTFFSVSFLYILYPFFITIFLSFILAFLFKGPHQFFLRKTNQGVAPFLTTVLLLVTVILPFFLVFFLISSEANKNYAFLLDKFNNGYGLIDEQLNQIPFLKDIINGPFFKESLDSFFSPEKILGYVNQALSYLFELIKNSVLDVGTLIISFFLILYLFYFICKDFEKINKSIASFIPLNEGEKEHFFDECKKIISAVIYGIFLVGFMEGAYGMLLFFILDIPSPVTWGVIMTVFSMLPILGTNTILVPLVLYKLISGEYLISVVLLLLGVGAVLVSQNVIKPKLVGDRSGLHPAIVAMSSLGGLVVMGMVGILIGPICATLFIVSWKEFRKKIILIKN